MQKLDQQLIRLAARIDKPWMWLSIAAVILATDLFTAPYSTLPFVIPVALATWHRGDRWILLAIILPATRLVWQLLVDYPGTSKDALAQLALRTFVLLVIGLMASRLGKVYRDLEKEVRLLEGILPICGYCKMIRDEQGRWESLERYISERSEAKFTHGVCPECQKKVWSDFNLEN